MFSAGLFNLDGELNFDHQIFIDEKPLYYCFADETKNMAGAKVLLRFQASNFKLALSKKA